MRSTSLHGIAYMIAAMLFFSLMNSAIRFSAEHLPSAMLVFSRNFAAVVVLGLWLKWRHRETPMPGSAHLKRHATRALLGVISMEMWFYVLMRLPMNEATALSFTAPLFASVIAIFALREKVDYKRIAALLLGFSGMLLVLRPGHLPETGLALMALCSAFMMAIGGTLIKSLTSHEHPDSIVFMQAAMMLPMAIPMALWHWQPLSATGFFWAGMVSLCSVSGHICLTRAFHRAEMTLLMPFDYTRLIFTSIFAWWWFAETLDAATAMGAGLILCGSLASVWLAKRKANWDVIARR